LSGMRGNSLVPFLEGLRAATPSGHSAGNRKGPRGTSLVPYFIRRGKVRKGVT